MPNRTRSILCVVSALGLLLSACDTTPISVPAAGSATAPSEGIAMQASTLPPAAGEGIHALVDSWTAAWNAADGIAYGRHYAADADFVNPLGAVLSGSAAIGATHAFLLDPVIGPFRGTTTSSVVRRMVALTGSVVLVDLTTTVTGFANTPPFPPPGLVQWEPGVVKTRHHLVVARNGAGWHIIAQQITAMQPGIPD